MRRSVELQIITEALQKMGPHAPAARIWGRAPGAGSDLAAEGNVWAGEPHDVALHIVTRLYGEQKGEPLSPLDEAGRGRSTAGRTMLIALALRELIPGADPASLSVEVKETLSAAGCVSNTWSGTPEGLAERIAAAVWGEASPLEQAEDAKRRRDIVGEVGALTAGHDRLTSAPWYPVRDGDLVHVHYEAVGDMPAFGETYAVEPRDGFPDSLQLCLVHQTAADEHADMTGVFAPGPIEEPLYEAWFEAGPQRLTIVRDGRPVHIGGAR